MIVDPSSMSLRQKTPKYVKSYVDCPEFPPLLGEDLFYKNAEKEACGQVSIYLAVRSHLPHHMQRISYRMIYSACKMAFRVGFALAQAFGQLFVHKIEDDWIPFAPCQAIQ